jgi:hypothetical protein
MTVVVDDSRLGGKWSLISNAPGVNLLRTRFTSGVQVCPVFVLQSSARPYPINDWAS